MKNIILFSIFSLALLVAQHPPLVQASGGNVGTITSQNVVQTAGGTCTANGTNGYTCSFNSGAQIPNGCTASNGGHALSCSTVPTGYSVSNGTVPQTQGGTCTTNGAGGYTCTFNAGAPLPSDCSASNGGHTMTCASVPTGFGDNSPTQPTCAGTSCGTIQYTPLSPLPGVPETGTVDFGAFINGLFKILFAVGALVAVGNMVVGGIIYMTSEVTEGKSGARQRMTGSLYGLLLLAGSYLILNTINPQLLSLSLNVSNTATNSTQQPGTATNASQIPSSDSQAQQTCEAAGGNYQPTLGTSGITQWTCVQAQVTPSTSQIHSQ